MRALRVSPYVNPFLFFFNDTATTEIYTLSLHDALPICQNVLYDVSPDGGQFLMVREQSSGNGEQLTVVLNRSEEHTSELQSLAYLVCRLLLEKKKKTPTSRCRETAE